MKGYVKIFCSFFFIIIPWVLIYPQTEQYKFRHLTTVDGLPSNVINHIMKDSHGMIWITTNAGLCRYDGNDIKVYQYNPADSNSLTHNSIYDPILEDTNGNLWIGTLYGLNKFDPYTEIFVRYTHNQDNPGSISSNKIRSLYQDKNGTIWIGTGLRGELNKYDPFTDSFTYYNIVQQDTLGLSVILSICEDENNVLWVGTSHGLYQFDRHNESFTPVLPAPPLPKNFIPKYRKILKDNSGNVWFISDKAILTYERDKDDSGVLLPIWRGKTQVTGCFFQDILLEPINGDQILWVVACGITKLNLISGDYMSLQSNPVYPESIAGTARAIFKDESGIIWVSSDQGVNILDKQRSKIEQHTEFWDKYQTHATVFLEDSKGNYWIGTGNMGVLQFDSEMNMINGFTVLKTNKDDNSSTGTVRAIIEDRDNNIWLGSSRGLYFLDRQKNKLLECILAGSEIGSKRTPNNVHVIFEDSDGIIWIGTQSGFYRNKKESQPLTTFTHILIKKHLMTRPVQSIFEDSFGYLWIGVDAIGLYCQTPELRGTDSFIHYKHKPENRNSLSNSNILSIYEDAQGNLWIGTRHGLNRYNRESNSFERIIFETNPAANFIYDITGDNNQNIWLSTQDGLLRLILDLKSIDFKRPYNPKRFLPYKNIYSAKISKNRSGRFFIGGKSHSGYGYFSFHLDSIKDNLEIPPVVITELQSNNKSVKLDSNILFKKHITLNYNENFFTFKFAALDYTDPDENQNAYYLEGLEDDWIYSGNRRLANYTGVAPGDYIFRAKGSNNDGYWNEEGASLKITILPPPWKTWWAYSLYLLFIISILYITFRFYLRRQQLLQKMALEQVQYEKLEELDRMKSRFFANISHEFRTPLTLILGPLEKIRTLITGEAKKDLDIMQRNALRLQNLINQLLNLSKLESGKMKLQVREQNIVAMVNGYIQSFESLAKQKKIGLNFKSAEKNIPLFVDKDKIEKILYNLLSNAFKFTGEGGRIEVAVHSQQSVVGKGSEFGGSTSGFQLPTSDSASHWVGIKISDTGRGIPREKLQHIFDRFYQADDSYTKDQEGTGIGLALTKELVELHHGKIKVESQLGKGTTFSVFLPIGKEHLKPEEIVVRKDSFGEPASADRVSPKALAVAQVSADKSVDWEYPPEQIIELQDQVTLIDDETEKEDSKPLLLIVEDNDDLRSYIRSYLTNDYRISEAIDGKMGLEKAIEKIPDLVISDVMMPKMDGYQLCQNLKSDERTSHIPVILLTARASMESRIEGLETGADDFITKPFDPVELQTRIKNLIVQRRKLQDRFMKKIRKMGMEHLLEIEAEDMTPVDQKFMQRVILIIQKYLSDSDFDVEMLSSAMALSRMQVHRKLIGLTGYTPGSFIRHIRLNKAAELLKNKTGTVSEIVFEVGFNNLSYFSKCFKKQFGVLPSEFNQ
jgi:signal transduction histidine kinase/ligand-binding sensor domain-containing protein/DNA-binding NarL/FixJ family response regulator